MSFAPYGLCDLGLGLPRPARVQKLLPGGARVGSWDLPQDPAGACGHLTFGNSGTSCKAVSKHSVASIDVNAQSSLRQEEDKGRAKWAKVWVSLVWHFQQDREECCG